MSGRRRGRPPRNGATATERIEFRCTPSERAQAERFARANGHTLADACRLALMIAVLDSEEGEPIDFRPVEIPGSLHAVVDGQPAHHSGTPVPRRR